MSHPLSYRILFSSKPLWSINFVLSWSIMNPNAKKGNSLFTYASTRTATTLILSSVRNLSVTALWFMMFAHKSEAGHSRKSSRGKIKSFKVFFKPSTKEPTAWLIISVTLEKRPSKSSKMVRLKSFWDFTLIKSGGMDIKDNFHNRLTLINLKASSWTKSGKMIRKLNNKKNMSIWMNQSTRHSTNFPKVYQQSSTRYLNLRFRAKQFKHFSGASNCEVQHNW
jgi:hypothetical protein